MTDRSSSRFQFSLMGAVAVTVGRLVISAGVSEIRIRRLASVKKRSFSRLGLLVSSLIAGRLMRSIGPSPNIAIGRSRRRAPVRPFRMLLLYVPVDRFVQAGSLTALPRLPVRLPSFSPSSR